MKVLRLARQNISFKESIQEYLIYTVTPSPSKHLYTSGVGGFCSIHLDGYQVKLKLVRNDCPNQYSMPVYKHKSKGTTLMPKHTSRAWKNCWYCAAHKTVKFIIAAITGGDRVTILKWVWI